LTTAFWYFHKNTLSFNLFSESAKRPRLIPPVTERIMVYVRQETEDVYTPLHLVPPTVTGLISAIENKYKINATNIRYLYRKNKDGIVAKIDDDMLRHYCNEDVFLMQVMVTEGPGGEETSVYDITLSEIHATMWCSFFGFESLKIGSFPDSSSAIWREDLISILLFCYWWLHNRCSYIKVPYREKFYIILFWCLYSKIIDILMSKIIFLLLHINIKVPLQRGLFMVLKSTMHKKI